MSWLAQEAVRIAGAGDECSVHVFLHDEQGRGFRRRAGQSAALGLCPAATSLSPEVPCTTATRRLFATESFFSYLY